MKAGFVALIGRPNVGKSTLLNQVLGQKLSITSRRPQTTRHQILGIKTAEHAQIIFVDTPGMHGKEKRAINRYLNRTANSSLVGVDVVVWIVDSPRWHDFDAVILERIKQIQSPVILAINKTDQLKSKELVLPYLDDAKDRFAFTELIPISALKGDNLDVLEQKIIDLLPEESAVFPEHMVTDRSERFRAAEMIREKLVRRLCHELPHALTVDIEKFERKRSIIHIVAVILVERQGQKLIVIGRKGENLKVVGQQAREDIQRMLGSKVFLDLWVKVKRGWSDNERTLNSLGYGG